MDETDDTEGSGGRSWRILPEPGDVAWRARDVGVAALAATALHVLLVQALVANGKAVPPVTDPWWVVSPVAFIGPSYCTVCAWRAHGMTVVQLIARSFAFTFVSYVHLVGAGAFVPGAEGLFGLVFEGAHALMLALAALPALALLACAAAAARDALARARGGGEG